jgi:sterol 3beta-glucosyltransferase
MAPADAARLSQVITDAARTAGVRLLVQAGQAGLTLPAGSPGQAMLVGDVPHEWLFPRLAAVIHHAGAGTTAAALRAGVPAIAVPMLGDQPFWAARVSSLGAGPRPIPLRRLTAPTLAAAIRESTTQPSYRHRAAELAARLAAEDGARPVIEAVAGLA